MFPYSHYIPANICIFQHPQQFGTSAILVPLNPCIQIGVYEPYVMASVFIWFIKVYEMRYTGMIQ